MSEKNRVIVIGGGASGFMAAITAARNGSKVTILEHMNFVAKKIEHTGNGRCNFTNNNQSITFYNNDNSQIVEKVLDIFSFDDTLNFFSDLGLIYRQRDGYYYPLNNQAAAISSLLKMEAEHLNIKAACNIDIIKIVKENGLFKIITDGYVYEAEAVILATGSKADEKTGSDGSGYNYAKAFGHTVNDVCPALVYLKSQAKEMGALAGLRTYAKVSLYIDNREIACDSGELQFIKNGLSGIPVFQVSRYASLKFNEDKAANVYAVIDFLPGFTFEELKNYIELRIQKDFYKNLTGFLTGFLHEKVISVIAAKMKIKGNVKVKELSQTKIEELCKLIKQMRFGISGTGDFNQAQVCAGGVSLKEVDYNLQSKLVDNLYFAGEILDVDGRCGGYNLQWAWSSGYVSGKAAAHLEDC